MLFLCLDEFFFSASSPFSTIRSCQIKKKNETKGQEHKCAGNFHIAFSTQAVTGMMREGKEIDSCKVASVSLSLLYDFDNDSVFFT